jgi:uncharacterized protein (DUF1015 family)
VAGTVASPPYDVLSAQEAREMAASNPVSFLRVNKAELEFDDGVDQYSEQVYQRGKDNLNRLIQDNVMQRDPQPCFYLYRLTWQGRSQTGLMALTSVDEYDAGKIKKHEHTRPEKVNDRATHISFLEAQVGPVLSTFRHDAEIEKIFKGITGGTPETSFEADDGVKHELWVINTAQDVKAITTAFAKLPHFYIADGHHRSAAASEVCRRMREKTPGYTGDEPFNFFLNVLFADSELRILPYNRVVNDLNGMTVETVLERVGQAFDVSAKPDPVAPGQPHRFGVYGDGKWFELVSKDSSFDPSHPTQSIDAAILSANLLAPVLEIKDLRTDKRIDFVGGIRGVNELVKLVNSGEYKMAFSLHPTTIDQLLNVADAGEVMPPKSTWFEPKLRSGMVVNLLTD